MNAIKRVQVLQFRPKLRSPFHYDVESKFRYNWVCQRVLIFRSKTMMEVMHEPQRDTVHLISSQITLQQKTHLLQLMAFASMIVALKTS